MPPSSQISRDIAGIHTDVLLQPFADSILVLVTQMGKVGCLIQASLPSTVPLLPSPIDPSEPNSQPLPSPPAAIEHVPLFGSAPSQHIQTLHSLYTSQIATLIWTLESEHAQGSSRRNVIVGIALRKSSGSEGHLTEAERETFMQVMSMLQELLKQP